MLAEISSPCPECTFTFWIWLAGVGAGDPLSFFLLRQRLILLLLVQHRKRREPGRKMSLLNYDVQIACSAVSGKASTAVPRLV